MGRLLSVVEVTVVAVLVTLVGGIAALAIGELMGRSAGGPPMREVRIGLSGDADAVSVAGVVRILETMAPRAEVAESRSRGRRQVVIVAPEGEVDHAAAYRAVAEAGLATGDVRTWAKPPALTEEVLFSSPSMMAILLAVQSVVLAGAAVLLLGRRWRLDDRPTRSLPGLLGTGVLLGIGLLVASLLLTVLLEAVGLPAREQRWVGKLFRGELRTFTVLIPLVVVAGPAAEELFFRGYVYRSVRSGAGVAAAMIVSTVLFAVLHMNPSAIAVYLLMGLVLAWSTERWSSLVVPWVAHTMNNLAAIVLVLARSG